MHYYISLEPDCLTAANLNMNKDYFTKLIKSIL